MEKLTTWNLPSPLEKINLGYAVDWFVKREDLIHSEISGNKYRKLKYIIGDCQKRNVPGILTFGGSFSNHIYSVAAYCGLEKIPCIGIIRGERDEHNPTLKFALSQGMKLYFVSRTAYRKKSVDEEIKSIQQNHPDYYIIPEGGDHPLAAPGVAEIITELKEQGYLPDYIALAAGTGSTASALIQELKRIGSSTKVLVIAAVKDATLAHKMATQASSTSEDFIFMDEYTLGGYAKTTAEFITFINSFYNQTGIPLDPIYNGKLVFALHDLIQGGYFKPKTSIVWLHTGGLQGIAGFNYMQKKKANGLSQVNLISY